MPEENLQQLACDIQDSGLLEGDIDVGRLVTALEHGIAIEHDLEERLGKDYGLVPLIRDIRAKLRLINDLRTDDFIARINRIVPLF